MNLPLLLAVAVAGGVGATLRYLVDHAVATTTGRAMPWGTLVVNVTGSFALGLLVGLAITTDLPERWTVPFAAGLLGAYTTFSTWMVETIRLIEQNAWRSAAFNALGSVVAGVLAAFAGLAIAQAV